MGAHHPTLSHFPIALLVAAFLFELLGGALAWPGPRHAARWCLYLGAVGAIAAVASGLGAQSNYPEGRFDPDLFGRHRLLGWITAGLAVALAGWRWRIPWDRPMKNRGAYVLGVFLLAFLAAWTATQGHRLLH